MESLKEKPDFELIACERFGCTVGNHAHDCPCGAF